MRIEWKVVAAALFISAISVTSFSQVKKAYLRAENAAGGERYYVEVILEASVAPGKTPESALYDGDGRQLTKSVSVLGHDRRLLRLDLPSAADPTGNFEVVIHEYETNDGQMLGGKAGAKRELAVKLIMNNPSCLTDNRGSYFSVSVQAAASDRGTPENLYRVQRLFEVFDWLKLNLSNPNLASIEVEPETEDQSYPITIKSAALWPRYKLDTDRPLQQGASVQNSEGFALCLALDEQPPTDQFDAKLTFNGSVPLELKSFLLATEVPGFSNIVVPSSAELFSEDEVPRTRSLEKNLDLGVSMTSSVKNEEFQGQTVRRRTTRGTFDFRFAPWLNTQIGYSSPRTKTWRSFYTPVFVDAKVSTGKIDEDTLSLNRIVIGTEAEFRYQQNTNQYPTFYRVNVRGSHASDRDFKQGEIKAGVELIPVFGRLVRRSTAFGDVKKHRLDPDEERSPKFIPGLHGYEIKPLIGAEFGRTYFRRNPAAAVKPSELVRRLYFGAEILLELTSFLNLKVVDTIYVRGESKQDRLHNYFNGEIEFPIGRRWANTAYSFFISFERGGQPPFATPDVNAVKIGYRVQSRNWFDRVR